MKKLFFPLLIAISIISCKADINPTNVAPQKFTVTFDSDGGNIIPSQEIERNHTVPKPENPIKKDYVFAGWYKDDSVFDFSTPITSNITLKAKWNAITFTVIFDSDGGSKISSQQIAKGNTATKPEDPYRERYSFIGWFLDENKFDFSTPITSDITLKAKWDGQVFLVKFDTDGGTEINNQYISKYGYARKPTNPIKDSCTFDGWFLDDTRFNFTTTQITSDITLKAKWIQNCTVTFNSDGGSSIRSKTVEKGTTITKPSNPSKEKYTFIGWYDGENEFDFSTPITSDITLKAKWENQVKVTFDYNGARPNNELFLDKGSLVTSPTVSRTNYTFKGWYFGDTLFDFSTPISFDITLTAKWLRIYTVKFDYDDPNHNVETRNVEEGELITNVPYNSKQSGYSLAGWLINGTEFNFAKTVVTSNITLKAKYYRDSITSTLTMKHGWGSGNFHNLPIVEVAIISRKGDAFNTESIIRSELTYLYKNTGANDHDVNFITEQIGEFSYNGGHTFAFDLKRITHSSNGYTQEGDDFKVSRRAYYPNETKYSIIEVKRDSQKKNMYDNWVDVITIYIDIDF